MGLIKCPRCELNYMNDTDKLCSVCRREVRGEGEQYNDVEMCSECGENPVVPGSDLCAYCLKEQARHAPTSTDDAIEPETTNIELDSVADMEEIELDLHGGLDGEVFDEEDDFDEEEEEEE